MAINFNRQNQRRNVSPKEAPTIRTLIFGRGSHLKFGEQATSGIKLDDADDFSKYKVAINSMQVAPTTQLLTPGVIPVTVDQFKGVPGPITIDGNFVLDALPRRQELFFRQLLNAPSSSITDTAATVLLAAGTLNAADSLTTQPTEPTRLRIVLNSATAMRGTPGAAISATNPVVVTVAGTNEVGISISEDLVFTAAGDPGAQVTKNTFAAVANDGITTDHGTGAAALAGDYAVNAGWDKVEISSSADYRLTPGLTVEAVYGTVDSSSRGGVPNTVVDGYLNTFSFNATREEIITYSFGLTAKSFIQNENPEGNDSAWNNSARSDGTTYGSGEFATIQDDQTPYAGYSACLYTTIAGDKVNFEGVLGLTLNFDNNTQFTPRLCTQEQGLAYNRQRTVSVEIELEYHSSDTDFTSAYLEARDWEDVELRLSDVETGRETRFVFPQVQLTEYPSMPVESDDFVRQTIRGMALPSDNNTADAVKIECLTGDDVASLALATLA